MGWAHGGPLWAGQQGAPRAGVIEAPGRWSKTLPGHLFAMVADDALGAVVVASEESAAELTLFDTRTGDARAAAPLRASEYLVVADAARCGDGVALAGSFAGALRVGQKSVSTAGGRDGFWARIDGKGEVLALGRFGGEGDDGVAAVDCAGDRLALAGSFSAGADVLGQPLPRMVERSIHPDAMLIVLRGEALQWMRAFGGAREDLAADVAIGKGGDIAVVGAVRDEAAFGDVTLTAQGLADGYFARWSADGASRGVLRLGGPDYDQATRVLATGDHFVVGGFFTGTADLFGAVVTSRGSDDAMLVEVRDGVPSARALVGEGREEIVAMARAARGLVLAVSHTAGLAAWGTQVAAPSDPLGGVALITLTER